MDSPVWMPRGSTFSMLQTCGGRKGGRKGEGGREEREQGENVGSKVKGDYATHQTSITGWLAYRNLFKHHKTKSHSQFHKYIYPL